MESRLPRLDPRSVGDGRCTSALTVAPRVFVPAWCHGHTVVEASVRKIRSVENVLVIMSDEHQRRALGCAGHPVAQTPHLDALAAGGTRFNNCWTPSPICVPARASLATGQWVHEIGTWDSAQAYTGTPQGWAHVMANAGHDAVSFGKLHHRSAADDDGFTDRHRPMYIAGGVGWLQGLSRRDPIPYDEASELAADVGVGETSYTHYDRRVTNDACAWLESTDRATKPWAAFVSFVAPHYPLSAPDEFAALYPLSDIPPPEIPVVEHTHPAVTGMQDFFRYGDFFDDQRTAEGRAAYFALCSFLDTNVGRVLDSLDSSGQRANTRIIYTSDHGEMLGNRGLWCKSFMFEDSVAVPMIISGPGVPVGQTVDANVNLIDVAPTITETIGVNQDGPGESLWHRAKQPSSDRVGFSEYHDGGSITGSFALRTDEWKYIHHEGYSPELYNMIDDPSELSDLADDPRVVNERNRCQWTLADMVDTAAVNNAAFVSQTALIEQHGGRDALASAFRFNHTPTP